MENIAEKIALKITEEFISDRISFLKEQRKKPDFVMEPNYFTNLSERSVDLFVKTQEAAKRKLDTIAREKRREEQRKDILDRTLEKNMAGIEERRNLENVHRKLEPTEVSPSYEERRNLENVHRKLEPAEVSPSQEQLTRELLAKYDDFNPREEQAIKDAFAMYDEPSHPKLR